MEFGEELLIVLGTPVGFAPTSPAAPRPFDWFDDRHVKSCFRERTSKRRVLGA